MNILKGRHSLTMLMKEGMRMLHGSSVGGAIEC